MHACACRQLLEAGYAVIFLHRDKSLQPYLHRASTSISQAHAALSNCATPACVDSVCANTDAAADEALARLGAHCKHGAYMAVPFVTVSDYLHLLRTASKEIAPAGRRGMVVLAAAVSDFYIPRTSMATHKIQSMAGGNKLELTLQPVPKALGRITREWAPHATVVSFKLETDPLLLLPKAEAAMDTHHVDAVVANLLDKRYDELHILSRLPLHDCTRLHSTQAVHVRAGVHRSTHANGGSAHGCASAGTSSAMAGHRHVHVRVSDEPVKYHTVLTVVPPPLPSMAAHASPAVPLARGADGDSDNGSAVDAVRAQMSHALEASLGCALHEIHAQKQMH
ncbi:hypothetical protein EON67_07685 [archaeon]|nr:MAG: hypothetical protein EON67_07685 [archaeon]